MSADTLIDPPLTLPGIYHNPGSISAVGAGCTCPTIDNRHGIGAYNGKPGEFWINGGCPLHGRNELSGNSGELLDATVRSGEEG